jgi:hypothetical protein
MLRKAFLVFLCVTLAFIGASGLHDHVVLPDHHHETAGHESAHAHVETHFFDAGHHDLEEHEGHVDVEPVSKAFGKLSPGSLLALAFCLVLWTMLGRTAIVIRRPPAIPVRAARAALFELLPPATAPPATAFSR